MSLASHWRRQEERYKLVGTECEGCGQKSFPPRKVCPQCHSAHLLPYRFSGKGEIYSYSTLYQAPAGYEEFVPYTVALIKLEEGPLITAQLTDMENDELKIGQPVEMVTRKLREYGPDGLIVYGYKFRKALKQPE